MRQRKASETVVDVDFRRGESSALVVPKPPGVARRENPLRLGRWTRSPLPETQKDEPICPDCGQLERACGKRHVPMILLQPVCLNGVSYFGASNEVFYLPADSFDVYKYAGVRPSADAQLPPTAPPQLTTPLSSK